MTRRVISRHCRRVLRMVSLEFGDDEEDGAVDGGADDGDAISIADAAPDAGGDIA